MNMITPWQHMEKWLAPSPQQEGPEFNSQPILCGVACSACAQVRVLWFPHQQGFLVSHMTHYWHRIWRGFAGAPKRLPIAPLDGLNVENEFPLMQQNSFSTYFDKASAGSTVPWVLCHVGIGYHDVPLVCRLYENYIQVLGVNHGYQWMNNSMSWNILSGLLQTHMGLSMLKSCKMSIKSHTYQYQE